MSEREMVPLPLPVTREQVRRLQSEMAKLPQVELPTEHYFANGMYARKLFCPKDVLIVGKVHRHEHLFVLAMGRMKVTTDEGVRVIGPGDVIVSRPGTKRAGLPLEDCIAITINRTDNTDLDAIEAEIIEPDGQERLFDSHNKLIHAALEMTP